MLINYLLLPTLEYSVKVVAYLNTFNWFTGAICGGSV